MRLKLRLKLLQKYFIYEKSTLLYFSKFLNTLSIQAFKYWYSKALCHYNDPHDESVLSISTTYEYKELTNEFNQFITKYIKTTNKKLKLIIELKSHQQLFLNYTNISKVDDINNISNEIINIDDEECILFPTNTVLNNSPNEVNNLVEKSESCTCKNYFSHKNKDVASNISHDTVVSSVETNNVALPVADLAQVADHAQEVAQVTLDNSLTASTSYLSENINADNISTSNSTKTTSFPSQTPNNIPHQHPTIHNDISHHINSDNIQKSHPTHSNSIPSNYISKLSKIICKYISNDITLSSTNSHIISNSHHSNNITTNSYMQNIYNNIFYKWCKLSIPYKSFNISIKPQYLDLIISPNYIKINVNNIQTVNHSDILKKLYRLLRHTRIFNKYVNLVSHNIPDNIEQVKKIQCILFPSTTKHINKIQTQHVSKAQQVVYIYNKLNGYHKEFTEFIELVKTKYLNECIEDYENHPNYYHEIQNIFNKLYAEIAAIDDSINDINHVVRLVKLLFLKPQKHTSLKNVDKNTLKINHSGHQILNNNDRTSNIFVQQTINNSILPPSRSIINNNRSISNRSILNSKNQNNKQQLLFFETELISTTKFLFNSDSNNNIYTKYDNVPITNINISAQTRKILTLFITKHVLSLFNEKHINTVKILYENEEFIKNKLILNGVKSKLKQINSSQSFSSKPENVIKDLASIVNGYKRIQIYKCLPNYILSNINISQKNNTIILDVHSKHYGKLKCLGDSGSDINLIHQHVFNIITKKDPPIYHPVTVGVCNGQATLDYCVQIELYRSNGESVIVTFYKSNDLIFDYLLGCEGLNALGLVLNIEDTYAPSKKLQKFHDRFLLEGDDPYLESNLNIINSVPASYLSRTDEPDDNKRYYVNKCITIARTMEATEEYDVGTVKDYKYPVKLKPDWTGWQDPIIPARNDLHQKFKNLLRRLTNIIIEPSTSPNYCNAYMLCKKNQDGSTKDRLIVNFKKLNDRTQKLYYKLTTLEDVFNALYGSDCYTSIDVNKAFYHLLIDEEHRDWFSFITQFGKYRLIRVVYGHCNAPMAFQKVIEEVIELLDRVIAFIDDILVYSGNQFDRKLFRDRYHYHFNLVVPVLERLKRKGFKTSSIKCSFMKNELVYVGFKISRFGRTPNILKINEIIELDFSKTLRQTQVLIGKINPFRQWINNYAGIMYPIYQLLKGKSGGSTRVTWSTAAKESLVKLKLELAQPIPLSYPDPRRPFILVTDASKYCIGGALFQLQPIQPGDKLLHFDKYIYTYLNQYYNQQHTIDNNHNNNNNNNDITNNKSNIENVSDNLDINYNRSTFDITKSKYYTNCDQKLKLIAYYSYILQNSEINYHISDKEVYSGVKAMEKFRSLVLGQEVHLFNDHKNFHKLMSKRELKARWLRWVLRLGEYNLILHFIPGNENEFADVLSRPLTKEHSQRILDQHHNIIKELKIKDLIKEQRKCGIKVKKVSNELIVFDKYDKQRKIKKALNTILLIDEEYDVIEETENLQIVLNNNIPSNAKILKSFVVKQQKHHFDNNGNQNKNIKTHIKPNNNNEIVLYQYLVSKHSAQCYRQYIKNNLTHRDIIHDNNEYFSSQVNDHNHTKPIKSYSNKYLNHNYNVNRIRKVYYTKICYSTSKLLLTSCIKAKHKPDYIFQRVNRRNSVMCSLCQNEFLKSLYLYRCNICDYYICTECMGKENIEEAAQLTKEELELEEKESEEYSEELYEPNSAELDLLEPDERPYLLRKRKINNKYRVVPDEILKINHKFILFKPEKTFRSHDPIFILENIIQSQLNDPICAVYHKILSNPSLYESSLNHLDKVHHSLYSQAKIHKQRNGLIVINPPKNHNQYRLLVPDELVTAVIKYYHKTNQHPGATHQYNHMKKYVYWNNMIQDIQLYVNICTTCQKNKSNKNYKNHGHYKYKKTTYFGELLNIDLVGSLPVTTHGNKYILTMQDDFTAVVDAIPLKDITQVSCFHGINSTWFKTYGEPDSILFDNGSQLVSKINLKLLELHDINIKLIKEYHQQENRLERFHRTLKLKFRILLAEGFISVTDGFATWDALLPEIIKIYNNTPHSRTKYPPKELIMPLKEIQKKNNKINYFNNKKLQKILNSNIDEYYRNYYKTLQQIINLNNSIALKHQDTYIKRMKNNINKNRKDIILHHNDVIYYYIGDRLVGNNQKLSPRFDGPVRVIKYSKDKTSITGQHLINNNIIKIPLNKIKLVNINEEMIKKSKLKRQDIDPHNRINIRS